MKQNCEAPVSAIFILPRRNNSEIRDDGNDSDHSYRAVFSTSLNDNGLMMIWGSLLVRDEKTTEVPIYLGVYGINIADQNNTKKRQCI